MSRKICIKNYLQRDGEYEWGVKRPKGQMRMSYSYLIRVPERAKRNHNKEAIFEEIIADNFFIVDEK